MAWATAGNDLGKVLVADPDGRCLGMEISREEFERRQAAMTPERRALSNLIVGHFAREAADLKRRHAASQ